MNDFDTSETTDTLSADLLSTVFISLPDYRPKIFSPYEYGVFKYFWFLISGFQQVTGVTLIYLGIYFIQLFAIVCLVSITYEQQNEEFMKSFQFFYIFLNFRMYDGRELPTTSFFLVYDMISFLTVLLFFYGFFMAYNKKFIGKHLRQIFVIFASDSAALLLNIDANYSSRLVCGIIAGKFAQHYFQAVFITLLFIAHLFIVVLASHTLYTSVYFLSGRFTLFNNANLILHSMVTFSIISYVYNLSATLMDYKNVSILMCIMNGLFGLALFHKSLKGIGMLNILNRICGTYSWTMMLACLLGALQIHGLIKSSEVVIFCIMIGFMVFFILFSVAYHFNSVSIFKRLDSPGELSDKDFMLFVQAGFKEGKESVINGDFIVQGLEKQREPWVYFGLIKFAGLLIKEPPYIETLLKNIQQDDKWTLTEKYILFEYIMNKNLKNTGDVPDDMRLVLNELEARIAQFQQVNISFSKKITENDSENFLLVEALATMKDLLFHRMMITKLIFPNSPEVLQLFSIYKSSIEGKDNSARKWKEIAESIQKGKVPFDDFTFIHALNLLPKARSKVLCQAQFEKINLSSSSSFSNPQLNVKSSFVTKSKNDSKQTINVFNSRKSVLMISITIIFCLTFVAIIIDYSMRYYISHQIREQYLNVISFNTNFTEVIRCGIKWLYLPIEILATSNYSLIPLANQRAVEFEKARIDWSLSFKRSILHSSNKFNETFIWMKVADISVRSFTPETSFPVDIRMFLTRFIPLYSSIVDDIEHGYKPSEINSFLCLTQCSTKYILRAIMQTQVSSNEYLNYSANRAHPSHYLPPICIFVMLIPLAILPYLIKKEIKTLTKLFPKNEHKDRTLLVSFLKQTFNTSITINTIYYVLLIVFFAISVSIVELVRYMFTTSAHVLETIIDNNTNDLLRLMHWSNSLWSLYMTLLTQYEYVDIKMIKENLEKTISFFGNGTRHPQNVYYSRVRKACYEFLLGVLHQYTNQTIEFNLNETLAMKNLFEHKMMPRMEKLLDNSIELLHDHVEQMDLSMLTTVEIFSFVNILVFVLIAVVFNRLKRSIPALMNLVKYLPETYIANSEQFLQLYQNSSQFSQTHFEFKRTTILDLLTRPCALVDESSIVISTNRMWLSYFDSPLEYTIGHQVNQFTFGKERNITTIDLDDNQKLIIINELKHEAEMRIKLSRMQDRMQVLKSTSIPKRFWHISTTVTERTGFIVFCTLIYSPNFDNDLSPDEWIEDIKTFEKWIESRCSDQDVDILRITSRDTVLVFGLNENLSPKDLVLQAMTTMIEIQRLAAEIDWPARGINIFATISCGDFCDFVFIHDKITSLFIFGPAVEKTIDLKEKIELNSIIICKQTMQILQSLKCGFNAEPIDDISYIFSIQSNESRDLNKF